MEAAVSNLTSPGDKVLVLSAGKFGERWVSLAKAFHCETVVLSKPYGQTFPIDEVQALLTPDVKAVFVQATETSTGVRHDVAALARLLKGTDALLVVDAITGLGTTAFDVDGDGIDVIIGGSQKALMIPPGLAYLAVSERAWASHGDQHPAALLLRSAQGAQVGCQGRERLHSRRSPSSPPWARRSIISSSREAATLPRDATC